LIDEVTCQPVGEEQARQFWRTYTDRYITQKELRENRPPREIATKALGDYLENIRFENCRINEGYLRALAL
jgi:hypothetical protein